MINDEILIDHIVSYKRTNPLTHLPPNVVEGFYQLYTNPRNAQQYREFYGQFVIRMLLQGDTNDFAGHLQEFFHDIIYMRMCLFEEGILDIKNSTHSIVKVIQASKDMTCNQVNAQESKKLRLAEAAVKSQQEKNYEDLCDRTFNYSQMSHEVMRTRKAIAVLKLELEQLEESTNDPKSDHHEKSANLEKQKSVPSSLVSLTASKTPLETVIQYRRTQPLSLIPAEMVEQLFQLFHNPQNKHKLEKLRREVESRMQGQNTEAHLAIVRQDLVFMRMHLMEQRMISALKAKHWTVERVERIEGKPGSFRVTIEKTQKLRYKEECDKSEEYRRLEKLAGDETTYRQMLQDNSEAHKEYWTLKEKVAQLKEKQAKLTAAIVKPKQVIVDQVNPDSKALQEAKDLQSKARQKPVIFKKPVDPMSADVQATIINALATMKKKKGAETIVVEYMSACRNDKVPMGGLRYTGLTTLLSPEFLAKLPAFSFSLIEWVQAEIKNELIRIKKSPLFAGDAPVFTQRSVEDYLVTVVGAFVGEIKTVPGGQQYVCQAEVLKQQVIRYLESNKTGLSTSRHDPATAAKLSQVNNKVVSLVNEKLPSLIKSKHSDDALETLVSLIEARMPGQKLTYSIYLKYIFEGVVLLSDRAAAKKFCQHLTSLLSDDFTRQCDAVDAVQDPAKIDDLIKNHVMAAVKEVKSSRGFGMISLLEKNSYLILLGYLTECLTSYQKLLSPDEKVRFQFLESVKAYIIKNSDALISILSQEDSDNSKTAKKPIHKRN